MGWHRVPQQTQREEGLPPLPGGFSGAPGTCQRRACRSHSFTDVRHVRSRRECLPRVSPAVIAALRTPRRHRSVRRDLSEPRQTRNSMTDTFLFHGSDCPSCLEVSGAPGPSRGDVPCSIHPASRPLGTSMGLSRDRILLVAFHQAAGPEREGSRPTP